MKILIGILILFIISFVLYYTLLVREDFVREDFKNNKFDDDEIIIVTYENESYETTKTNNLITALKKLGYPYINIIGKDEIWDGWSGRTIAYRKFMKTFPNKNAYICVCDGRDVLPNTSYDNFKSVLSQRYNGKIIFGAENNCCTGSLETSEYKSKHMQRMREIKVIKSNTDTDAYYLNFGLAFGKVKDFIDLFEKMDVNKNDFDDQAEAAIMYENNDEFELDYDEKLGCNIAGNTDEANFTSHWWPYLLMIERRHSLPCFFHFPGKNKCYETVLHKINNALKTNV